MLGPESSDDLTAAQALAIRHKIGPLLGYL
jgi:hypothetical protein